MTEDLDCKYRQIQARQAGKTEGNCDKEGTVMTKKER